jgi:hypothetical protein
MARSHAITEGACQNLPVSRRGSLARSTGRCWVEVSGSLPGAVHSRAISHPGPPKPSGITRGGDLPFFASRTRGFSPAWPARS